MVIINKRIEYIVKNNKIQIVYKNKFLYNINNHFNNLTLSISLQKVN